MYQRQASGRRALPTGLGPTREARTQLARVTQIRYEDPMSTYDNTDPLGLLMTEWSLMTYSFWAMLIAGASALLLQDRIGAWSMSLGIVLVVAALGLPLLKCGQTLVIVGNELRKQPQPPPAGQEPLI